MANGGWIPALRETHYPLPITHYRLNGGWRKGENQEFDADKRRLTPIKK
jgi:hypothetical protein